MTGEPRWGTVEPLGWTRWAELRGRLDGTTCAWTDLDGLHIAAPPREAPITTHLWAWRPGWWLRARIDADRAVAGILRLANNEQDAEPVFVRRTLTWRPGTDRVAKLPPDVLDRAWLLLEVVGSRPVTFVGKSTSDLP